MLSNLFWEKALPDEKASCLYTIKNYDHKGLPSLKRLYMETGDLTEYTFALLYMEDFQHWEKLCAQRWFKEYIEQWRKELALKIQSEAVRNIILEAADPKSRSKFAANKWLIENGFAGTKTAGVTTRGRPKKEDLHRAIENEKQESVELKEAFERIFN